ncbi:hypothetical protein E5K00_21230 [Hymenobacter aquaticus]|uniref:Carboxypeptidase regulatory-like domain-containing protein n=1 Tax=Hymenobacter aquaticus TaxID=1867101 RepID=A0A4Z0PT91_9BACT|nr:hypothetical protein [Hymenobacter aquaticus]TGE20519.1 hypothetical protein E5K00_21230 [Hymenobacter aquaticus]
MPHSPVSYGLLLLCLLLALGLTLATLRRTNQQRRWWRLTAGGLAVLALWFTAYPPQHSVRGTRIEAILLTPGYHPDSLQRVVRQLGPATPMWRLGFAAPSDTPTLPSLLLLRERYPALRRLHVLGDGIPPAELANLGPLRLVLHKSAPRPGFQQIGWSRHLAAGLPLLVEGRFSAASSAPGAVWVSLRGPGRTADSVRLPAGNGSFRLRFLPKAPGRALYQLVARQAGKLMVSEPVPVEVTAPQPLRILLLSSTASFEFRFLKNYLGRQRHLVALRTGLSRGLTQTEFLNQPPHDLSRLTPALLARYDAVIADAGTAAALSSSEAGTLNAAIRNTGLGFTLLADPAPLPRTAPARASFTVQPSLAASADRPQRIRWLGTPDSALALVPATLRLAPTARPLFFIGTGRPVGAVQRLGLGVVAVVTLSQTFPWALQAADDTYAAYWSHVLRAVARPLPVLAHWQPLAAWPRPHEPLQLRLESSTFPGEQPTVSGPSPTPAVWLALQQDAQLPEWKTACFWPSGPGWHLISQGNQPAQAFYVFAPRQWASLEQASRQQAALPWLAAPASKTDERAASTRQPYPSACFFGLFLLAAGFLWLEEKL